MIVSQEREQRQQWLNGLKVGDKVAIYLHSNWHCHYSIETITKITPTRMMDVGRYRFNNDGREKGDYYGHRLEPLTKEITEEVSRYHAIAFLKQYRFENLTSEQMLAILDIIKEGK